jgi:electron transport complex protein RnfC
MKGDWEMAEENHIMDCIECGSCNYTCPSNRPLLDYIRLGKGKVGGILRARTAAKKAAEEAAAAEKK